MTSSPIVEARQRRDAARDAELYSPWNPAELMMRAGRGRTAAQLLQATGHFPRAGGAFLEVGYGQMGWLAQLLEWGAGIRDLHGIEVDAARAEAARRALPGAHLRIGDAAELPWPDDSFDLVVSSTVFTSILDDHQRRAVANEIDRVLSPSGALLWYDFAWNNPRNPDVRGIGFRELRGLFPAFKGRVQRVTLAPPLARLLAPRALWLATLLETLPFLRSHLLAVLSPSSPSPS